MKKIISKLKGQAFLSCVFSLAIMFFLICMIASPEKFIKQSLNGISAWAFNVLPSVLPFMFFTKLLAQLDFVPKLVRPFESVSKAFFKTPAISIYTFAMAVLSGYPVGSKMVADLYVQRKISQEEAFKMSAFCSTSGPMFIVGAVGIGMLHSVKMGYVLFASHVVGAVLNGMAFRKFKINPKNSPSKKIETNQNSIQKDTIAKPFDLSEIVTSSTLSILSVGCIITIFFIVIECFEPMFLLLPQELSAFLQGIVEITKGCSEISALSSKFLATALASFVISFGGISTILQSITMLAKLKMPTKLFIFQKLTHAIFSCLVTVLLLTIFGC